MNTFWQFRRITGQSSTGVTVPVTQYCPARGAKIGHFLPQKRIISPSDLHLDQFKLFILTYYVQRMSDTSFITWRCNPCEPTEVRWPNTKLPILWNFCLFLRIMSYCAPLRSVFANIKSAVPFLMSIGLIYQVKACCYHFCNCSVTQRDPMGHSKLLIILSPQLVRSKLTRRQDPWYSFSSRNTICTHYVINDM